MTGIDQVSVQAFFRTRSLTLLTIVAALLAFGTS